LDFLEGGILSDRIESVGIYADPKKPDTISSARTLAGTLRDIEVLWEKRLARAAGLGDGVPTKELGAAQLVMTLGGDGTMLAAARDLAPAGVPIMGINLGRLGFLTALLPHELEHAIPEILAGNYRVEERMMFETSVAELQAEPMFGLNEMTLDKAASPRILHLTVYVSGHLVSNIGADGVIVSTPTGSTAYSMAAGGAILAPGIEAFIITALAPYTLAIRPLIVSANDIVEIQYTSRDADNPPHLRVDGQTSIRLPSHGVAIVRRAQCMARFVSYHKRSFYDVLRTKLGWGPPPAGK